MTLTLRLEPLGATVQAERGTPLRDLLFPYGVEFPCGGEGTCGNCRVVTSAGETILACQHLLADDLTLRLGGWEQSILTSHPAHRVRGVGRGIAIDLGTTTIAAELVDGETGTVLGLRAELNGQAAYGADVMTRVGYALTPEGRLALHRTITEQIDRMVRDLSPEPVPTVITGNTAMHHFYGNLDPAPLATFDGVVTASDFLPVPQFVRPIAGFVGSDILAGILATGMDETPELSVLLDLGTNGEIVAGTRDRLVCASTAAGPAFEAGRISCGMRAATGAVTAVEARDGVLHATVLGGGPARGICGSGLVDAAAAALELGLLAPSGRIQTADRRIDVSDAVHLQQADIRELQLAKAAIAAGLGVLLDELGARPEDVRHLYLAGAFGNYVRQRSARRIGLLPFDDTRVEPVGNASLAGAKLILFTKPNLPALLRRIDHIPLHLVPAFEEAYIDNMRFPAA